MEGKKDEVIEIENALQPGRYTGVLSGLHYAPIIGSAVDVIKLQVLIGEVM
jgi:hypothetical protein